MLFTCVALEGLKALTYVVQQDANLALQHQMTIIECMNHSDLIIKREVGGRQSLSGWKYLGGHFLTFFVYWT